MVVLANLHLHHCDYSQIPSIRDMRNLTYISALSPPSLCIYDVRTAVNCEHVNATSPSRRYLLFIASLQGSIPRTVHRVASLPMIVFRITV